jgi:hypothetical protein
MSDSHAFHNRRKAPQAKTKPSTGRREAREFKEVQCASGRIDFEVHAHGRQLAESVSIDEVVRLLDAWRVIPHVVMPTYTSRIRHIRIIVESKLEEGILVKGEAGGFHLSTETTRYIKNVARREEKEREAQRIASLNKKPVIDPTTPGFSWGAYSAAQLAIS